MIAAFPIIAARVKEVALLPLLLLAMGCDRETNVEDKPPPRKDRQAAGHSPQTVISPPNVRTQVPPEIERTVRSLLDRSVDPSDVWNLGMRESDLNKLLEFLFDLDPDLAKQLAETAPDAIRGMQARRGLIRAWALTDPLGCISWIQASDLSSDQRNALRLDLLGNAALAVHSGSSSEPWLALLTEMKTRQPESKLIAVLEAQLAEPMGRTLPLREALALLEVRGPLTSRGLHAVLGSAAERNLDDVLTYLESRPEEKAAWFASGGDAACVRIIAKRSPEDAFNWAISREDPTTAERTVREAVKTWLPISAADASVRVASLPKGQVKDAAIAAMIDWLHRMESAHEIAPWLDEFSSPQLRKHYEGLSVP